MDEVKSFEEMTLGEQLAGAYEKKAGIMALIRDLEVKLAAETLPTDEEISAKAAEIG